jgi:hypothetical protein
MTNGAGEKPIMMRGVAVIKSGKRSFLEAGWQPLLAPDRDSFQLALENLAALFVESVRIVLKTICDHLVIGDEFGAIAKYIGRAGSALRCGTFHFFLGIRRPAQRRPDDARNDQDADRSRTSVCSHFLSLPGAR